MGKDDPNRQKEGESRESYKERLARDNFNTVYHVANLFRTTRIPYDELVSIGLYGYAKAIESYQPDRGTKFSTYAITCIRNEILHSLKKEKKRARDLSLQKALATDKNGKDLVLEDILVDEHSQQLTPLDELIKKEDVEIVNQIVSELDEDEQIIIRGRYELGGHEKITQEELTKIIGLSQSSISKKEKKILNKMLKKLKSLKNNT